MKGLTKAQRHKGLVPPPPSDCSGILYKVSKGESLFIIAKKQRVTLANLIAANPQIVNPDLIYVDQVICIPKQEKDKVEFTEIILYPTPEATQARGIAFVRDDTEEIIVVASNLPSPDVLLPNAEIYTAYLLDEATGNVERFELELVNDLWIGQRINKSVRQFDFLIIAPDVVNGSLLPGEPVVLEGTL